MTSDAPHDGEGHPPRRRPSANPTARIAPTGLASQVDSDGPPLLHTRAHSTWRADPNSPPGGRAIRGGGVTDLRRPCQRQKAAHPGTPFRHPRSAQRRPARAHAVGTVLGTHARADRTRHTRVAQPRLPSPGDGRPAEGQRLTPDAPSQRWQATPPGTAPTTPAARSPHRGCQPRGQCWAPTSAHLRRQHVGGRGGAPDPRRPSQRRKAPPTGAPFRKCPQGRRP